MQADENPRNSSAYRAARLAVIILTTLLALGIIAVAWGFMRQYRALQASRAAAPVAANTAPAMPAATVTLAPGARIVWAQTDAGRLVLHVKTGAGDEIDIIDLATGRLTARVVTPPVLTPPVLTPPVLMPPGAKP